MHFTEYDTRLAAYAVLVDDQDRLLLSWFNGAGPNEPCWTMPGGGVDYDEVVVEDAVRREVREETGYWVEVGRPLVVHSWVGHSEERGRPYKSLRILFEATITGGELGTLEVGGSTDFAEWVPLADVPTLSPQADIIGVALEALRVR